MNLFSKIFNKKQEEVFDDEDYTVEDLEVIEPDDIEKVEVFEEELNTVITTTEEELIAYGIIVGMLYNKVTADRLVLRDKKTVCTILLDNNNRKPVAKLWLEGRVNYIATFDEKRKEHKHKINEISDITKLRSELIKVLKFYDECS